MAYDFTGVKAITIPEGNVKKITDSAGNVLWQKVIVIENEPEQKGTLTYTGEELSPEWYYYDETMMTCTGGNVRTNAGTYFAVFKPNDGYCWSDGSVDPKTIRWTIKKAAGSVSVDPTSITFYSPNTSETITVTRAGDGAITATSSDTSVVTISVNDNIVTATRVGYGEGDVTITIKVAAGTNHNASADVAVEVTFIPYIDYNIYNLCPISIANLDTWQDVIDSGSWECDGYDLIVHNGMIAIQEHGTSVIFILYYAMHESAYVRPDSPTQLTISGTPRTELYYMEA